jgi:hypothetical protein
MMSNPHDNPDPRPHPLHLERVAAGEAPAEGLDAEGQAEVARLREDDRRILEAYPPRREVLGILQKVEGVRRRESQAWRRAVLAAAPVCAAVVLLATVGPNLTGERPGDEIRTKGPAVLQVFRQTPEGEERLAEQAPVHAQDVLQLRYDARGAGFGVILSVDGRGVVTPHLPDRLEGPAAALGKGLVTLPAAYELDDAPGYERFFIVTGRAPFEVQAVVSAIQRLGADPGPLSLQPGLTQVSLRLEKEHP